MEHLGWQAKLSAVCHMLCFLGQQMSLAFAYFCILYESWCLIAPTTERKQLKPWNLTLSIS